MNTIITGVLNGIESLEWEMEGKKGVSYKLAIYSVRENGSGVLNKVSIKAEEVDSFKGLVGKEITVECSIFIQGTYKLTYIPS